MSNVKSLRNEIREKEKAKKKRKLMIPIAIVAALVIIFLSTNFLFKSNIKPTVYTNVNGQTVGLASAPVKVEEYSNFNCIHCKNFLIMEDEPIVKKYAVSKVQFTFHHSHYRR